jgi:malate dehydrogenase (oxaloacetate-decarboxylating)(NADP+)
MHDDQHGTAIISAAALLNALELQKKKIDKIKLVVIGAGAAAISCSKLYVSMGARLENIVMIDREGVIRADRQNHMDETKRHFATKRNLHTLEDAMIDADAVIGLSSANTLTPAMLKSMAKNPIVFAMANPDPEIEYNLAINTRKDLIMATGRSDYPNQVNNVLGFPYIFRGALDVRATAINEEMKIAAVKAIADLAKLPVPEAVNLAYNQKNITFGKDYIIPKPLDFRLISHVAPAVAKAAIDSGVARHKINDWETYKEELNKRLGLDDKLIRTLTVKAKSDPKRVVFAEADNYKILKAAQIVKEEGIAIPILLGDINKIHALIEEHQLELSDVQIFDPKVEDTMVADYAQLFFEKRKRRGVTEYEAKKAMRDRNHFGAMMLDTGLGDALISGLTKNYPLTIRPALQIIGTEADTSKVAGMYLMLTKQGPIFLADTTVNIDPNVDELVEITKLVAKSVSKFNISPRIAMLSYSNFGNSETPNPMKVRKAVEILHQQHPELIVDGEMQANFALNPALLKDNFPFSTLNGAAANTLIFPNLDAGNAAYKILQEIGGAEAVGPILIGMKKPVHILQLGSSVREIVNMVTIAVVDAQSKEESGLQKVATKTRSLGAKIIARTIKLRK